MHRDDLPPDPPDGDATQDEDPDRAAILARRKRFITLAMAGLATGVGCAQPCLSISRPQDEEGGEQKSDTAPPDACLKVGKPPEQQPPPEATPPAGDPANQPAPEACLKVAAPPREPDPANQPEPAPCLKVAPPPKEPEPTPEACLRVAKPPEPKAKPTPCLKIARPPDK